MTSGEEAERENSRERSQEERPDLTQQDPRCSSRWFDPFSFLFCAALAFFFADLLCVSLSFYFFLLFSLLQYQNGTLFAKLFDFHTAGYFLGAGVYLFGFCFFIPSFLLT